MEVFARSFVASLRSLWRSQYCRMKVSSNSPRHNTIEMDAPTTARRTGESWPGKTWVLYSLLEVEQLGYPNIVRIWCNGRWILFGIVNFEDIVKVCTCTHSAAWLPNISSIDREKSQKNLQCCWWSWFWQCCWTESMALKKHESGSVSSINILLPQFQHGCFRMRWLCATTDIWRTIQWVFPLPMSSELFLKTILPWNIALDENMIQHCSQTCNQWTKCPHRAEQRIHINAMSCWGICKSDVTKFNLQCCVHATKESVRAVRVSSSKSRLQRNLLPQLS